MIITDQSLDSLFKGFNSSFQRGFIGAESHYRDFAMVVPSSTRENTYGWMGQFPKVREWIGDRIVKNLSAHGYSIVNRKFENTVSVERTTIEDDQFGIYSPIMEEMGKASAELPDELSFGLLREGFARNCYDGQYFFDVDHPVINPATGLAVSVSNMQAGAGPAWYLLDTSRAIKPILYQERAPFVLTTINKNEDERVFMKDEYLYGTRGRCNVGYGLWQLAYASKAELTPENYAAARAAMQRLRGDEGRLLGIKPTLLVVPTDLEEAGRTLLNSELLPSHLDSGSGQNGQPVTGTIGGTNPWKGSATLLVTPWIG